MTGPPAPHVVMSTIALAVGAKSVVAESDKRKTAAHSISSIFAFEDRDRFL